MSEYEVISDTDEILEDTLALNEALEALSNALAEYTAPTAPIQTQGGLKRSCVWYKRYYDVQKAIKEKLLDVLKPRQNEAGERLGLPESNDTDLIKLHWRKSGRPLKSLTTVQREMAETNPAFKELLDTAQAIYDAQPTGKRTIVVKWNNKKRKS